MHLEAIYTILWLFACIACITVYCVGFRAITAEDKILYFLRKGYDNIKEDEQDKSEKKIKELELQRMEQLAKIKDKEFSGNKQAVIINNAYEEGIIYVQKLCNKRISKRKWLLNPIVACCACFASFWGSIIFWGLNLLTFDFHWKMIPAWIFCCVSASFFNWLLWDKTDK